VVVTTSKLSFIGINLISLMLFIWVPIEHAKMLIILIFALTGWSMKILPQPVTSLIIIVLMPLLGIGSFSESLAGFSKPFVWLLISAFVFAAAMETTGIGKRIAFTLLYFAKGRTNRIVPYLFITLVTLGFFIPTSAGRSATIMPVCKGVIGVIKDKKQSIHFAKNIMLGVTFTSGFVCWGLMTGSNSSIYAVSAIDTLVGYKWSYAYWFVCNFPIMLITLFFLWLILKKLYPINIDDVSGGFDFISKELTSLGKMKPSEWRIFIIIIATLIGWITEPYHGLSVPFLALIGSIVSCLPLIGVQTWKEVSPKISWDSVILFGAGVAIAEAMHRNETASWLALKITDIIPVIHPFAAALFIMIFVLFLRLGFAEMLAITATLLPVTLSLAVTWGINPVWLIQIMIIACSFGYFLPFQSTSNLIAYSYGYFTEKDLLKTGALLSPVIIIIVLVSALIYWPLIGLSPYH
jgi:solute carrier family 13 (sodium-dependent dicarboxylate transporter), member 2/3/5